MNLTFLIFVGFAMGMSANNDLQNIPFDHETINGQEVAFTPHDRQLVLHGSENMVPLAQNTRQDSRVSGVVIDQNDQPLPGVTVIVAGTTIGTVTDTDGKFSLTIPDDAEILQFSFVGMRLQEVPVEGRTTFTIVMEEETIGIDEVVAIGYGTMSREMITTSVTRMDSKVLEDVPFSNIGSALQGSLPGVRVQNTSGQPGSAPRIIVRGGTSINNPNGASPLYVVDGVIRPNINHLASTNIESIQVLKDAASTAIYGARGSNGVVLITTKSGQTGISEVRYSSDVYFSSPSKLHDLAGARDYLHFARRAQVVDPRFPDASFRLTGPSGFGTGNDLTNNTAYTTQYLTPENEHKLNEGWEQMPDPVDPSRTLIFKDTDIQDVLFRNSVSNHHNLAFSGGTQDATFNAAFGYMDNQGTAINTDFKRYTVDIAGDFKISNRLTVFGRTNYAKTIDHQVTNITHIFARAITLPPTMKYRFEDGTLAPGTATSEANPEYILSTRQADNSSENLTLTAGAKWDILENLSFEPQVSLYNIFNHSSSFWPTYLNGPGNWVDARNASASDYRWRQTQADGVFSYYQSFGLHNFDAKLGLSYYDRRVTRLSASGRGAATDNIPTLNASAEPVNVNSDISDQIIAGLFSRLNYNYANKYMLTFNMRYDGASNLGQDYKWAYFPGVSVGWNMHNEDFWASVPAFISRTKLRTSYGVNGNISGLGDFTAQGSYSVGARYSDLSAIVNNVMANDQLQWERSKTVNIGTDLGFFENRLNFMVDAYRRVTDNLITSYSLPPSTGFGSVLTNLGSLENKGLEIELNYNVFSNTSGFQWNIGFNNAWVKNTILELPYNGVENNRIGGYYVWDPSIDDYNWLGGLQEGGTMGDYYSFVALGIFATDEEAENAPYEDTYKRDPSVNLGGDVIWNDLDGDGIIDSRDRAFMGNIYPDMTGGFNNTFSYKNLMLYIRMDYAIGHTIYNYGRAFMDGQWKLNMNLTQEAVENAWQEQGDQANLPRYDWESVRAQINIHPNRVPDNYYESGDFLALREITLSYQLPESLISFANLRLNITGNNLHYFTEYKGLNPEFGGRDYGRYPIARNIIFGVNVIF